MTKEEIKKEEINKEKQEVEIDLVYMNAERDILDMEIQQFCSEIENKERKLECLEISSEELNKKLK